MLFFIPEKYILFLIYVASNSDINQIFRFPSLLKFFYLKPQNFIFSCQKIIYRLYTDILYTDILYTDILYTDSWKIIYR